MLEKVFAKFNQVKKEITETSFYNKGTNWRLIVVLVALSSITLLQTIDLEKEALLPTAAMKPQEEKKIVLKKERTEIEGAQEAREVREAPQISRGNLNRHEVTLLAMVIEGEAAGEPFEGKVAVGSVILNRMDSEQFPGTLSGVVYQKWAFESVMNNMYKRPLTQESIQAAQAAIQGQDPTKGALYFWNPQTATSDWVWSRPVTGQIGRHVFAK